MSVAVAIEMRVGEMKTANSTAQLWGKSVRRWLVCRVAAASIGPARRGFSCRCSSKGGGRDKSRAAQGWFFPGKIRCGLLRQKHQVEREDKVSSRSSMHFRSFG